LLDDVVSVGQLYRVPPHDAHAEPLALASTRDRDDRVSP